MSINYILFLNLIMVLITGYVYLRTKHKENNFLIIWLCILGLIVSTSSFLYIMIEKGVI